MPDYKAIHGKNIQHLASDLDTAEAEGEIWFNTASSDYKTIVKPAGAFGTGGNLNTARQGNGSVGTQTAALSSAGITEPGAKTGVSEEYNGATWAEGDNVNTT